MASSSASPLSESVTFAFAGRTASNRFCKAATTERMSTWDPADRAQCGIPTPAVARLFARYSEGGPGLIVTGAITVDPAYLEAPGNSIIPVGASHADGRFAGFQSIARAAQSHGSLVLGQLIHTGRQTMAALQPDPLSASDVQLQANEMGLEYNRPHPATDAEMTTLVDAFAHGAAYLEAAGFAGVQLNAAHGYLFSQFLSPRTNRRSDRYGGSLANRARLLLDIVGAIRERCSPRFILSVKINCIEYQPDPITLDEVAVVCGWLEAARVDMIELSGGTYEAFGWNHVPGHTTPCREGYFLDAADAIRPALHQTRLYATGGFGTVAAMCAALAVVDGIGLARALCQEPDLCRRILYGQSAGRAPPALDQTQYSLTAMLAGSQMRQMAQGQEPVDGGDPSQMERSQQMIPDWIEDMTTKNVDGTKFGWMKVQ